MFYRRKLLLAILEENPKSNKTLEKINLHTIVFLFSKNQRKPLFSFVPYKYGCHSFELNNELRILASHYKLIKDEDNSWSLLNNRGIKNALREEDKEILEKIFKDFDINNTKSLIDYTYDNHPYFAINSERQLKVEQKKAIQKEKQRLINQKDKTIFSLGYEGISIDAYLNKLIENNIAVLCDVRKNAWSMKYGFSKNQLKKYCECVKIIYTHLGELGIDSEKRKSLHTTEDYQSLFKEYSKTIHSNAIEKVIQLAEKHKRVALTCFEKQPQHCHRSIITKKLQARFPVKHL